MNKKIRKAVRCFLIKDNKVVVTKYKEGNKKEGYYEIPGGKIEEGETTPDGKFSIDSTRCVGACGIAPVFTVNNEVYGRATVKKLDEVLDQLEKQ